VGAQGRRALGQEEAAAPLAIGKQHHGHRGGLAPLDSHGSPVERGKIGARPLEQRQIEAHA
jgi:hypothetical protein